MLIAKFAFSILVLCIILLALHGDLFTANPWVISAQAAGLLLILSARVSFGSQRFNISAVPADGPLLHRGPYRVIRHPMYAGALLITVSSALGSLNPVSAIIGLFVALLILARVEIEEKMLRERYTDYAGYATVTKRLLPFMY